MDRGREPVPGEVIVVVTRHERVRAKVASFYKSTSGSTTTCEIDVAEEEDDGNPPGHREADEDDF